MTGYSTHAEQGVPDSWSCHVSALSDARTKKVEETEWWRARSIKQSEGSRNSLPVPVSPNKSNRNLHVPVPTKSNPEMTSTGRFPVSLRPTTRSLFLDRFRVAGSSPRSMSVIAIFAKGISPLCSAQLAGGLREGDNSKSCPKGRQQRCDSTQNA
jgi:hypothetical protein